MTDWLSVDHSDAPQGAAAIIRQGGLIILPTDTVYGVAASVWQPDAVAALYRVKQRPPDRAIPILMSDPVFMKDISLSVPPDAQTLAEVFWPGPLTIVIPKRPEVPEIVSSLPTVGARIPDHDATRAVIRACGGLLAVTSANLSDHPSPLTAHEAATALGDGVSLVLDGGACRGGVPSTVIDVTSGELHILRQGPINEQSLRQALRYSDSADHTS